MIHDFMSCKWGSLLPHQQAEKRHRFDENHEPLTSMTRSFVNGGVYYRTNMQINDTVLMKTMNHPHLCVEALPFSDSW